MQYQSSLSQKKMLKNYLYKSLLHGWRKLVQGWVANYFMTAEKWDESHKTSKNVWFILQGHRFLFFFSE